MAVQWWKFSYPSLVVCSGLALPEPFPHWRMAKRTKVSPNRPTSATKTGKKILIFISNCSQTVGKVGRVYTSQIKSRAGQARMPKENQSKENIQHLKAAAHVACTS